MRFATLAIGGLLVAVVGFVAGRSIDRKWPPGDGYTNPFERLQAGYAEIPATACTGTPTGLIRIKLTNILGRLNAGKTVERDIAFFKVGDMGGEAILPSMVKLPELAPGDIKGFPTTLDFGTEFRGGQRLVDTGSHVVVRVVLDQEPMMNDGVQFLHPQDRTDSAFAVMRSVAPNWKMFCGRQPIRYEPVDGRARAFVDFGIQSTGGPASGSFGIGLLVRDPKVPFVTPIILDPNVRNKG